MTAHEALAEFAEVFEARVRAGQSSAMSAVEWAMLRAWADWMLERGYVVATAEEAEVRGIAKLREQVETLTAERDIYDRWLNELRSAVLRAVPNLPDELDWKDAESIIRAGIEAEKERYRTALVTAVPDFVARVNARAEADILAGRPPTGAHHRAIEAELAVWTGLHEET